MTKIVQGDITTLAVDAIVNPTDLTLSGSGGLDWRIQTGAGEGLQMEWQYRKQELTAPGQVILTSGYALPARFILHTAGPKWQGGFHGEQETLKSCYRGALDLAAGLHCETLAFPLISAGTNGIPGSIVLDTAVETISAFLEHSDMTVYLVLYAGEALALSRAKYGPVEDYLNARAGFRGFEDTLNLSKTVLSDALEAEGAPLAMEGDSEDLLMPSSEMYPSNAPPQRRVTRPRPERQAPPPPASSGKAIRTPMKQHSHAPAPQPSLEELLRRQDAGFSDTLLKTIDEKGLTDAQCYKRANIDRKLFSKIRSNKDYKPSKLTVLAFAVALELTEPEAEALLRTAGFAFSPASKLDIIVAWFLREGEYNIFTINEVLFYYDLPTLGQAG